MADTTSINDYTAGIRRRVREITKAGEVIGPLTANDWNIRLIAEFPTVDSPPSREQAERIAAMAFMASASEAEAS